MDVIEEQIWEEILLEAVEKAVKDIDGAVPGARLKLLISTLATNKKRSFPPAEFAPPKKFRDFLNHFEAKNVIVTRVRVGQDMLIAPAEKHSLLVNESRIADRGGVTFRKDLFLAFTQISVYGFRYLRSQDRFEQCYNIFVPDSDMFLVPPVTIEQSIKDRQDFCSENDNVESIEVLRQYLNIGNNDALRRFGERVRELGMQVQWHRFRVKLLEEKIRSWVNEKGIVWLDAWWSNHDTGSGRHDDTSDILDQLSPSFLDAVANLRPADLTRISLPLDIVVRLFNQRSR